MRQKILACISNECMHVCTYLSDKMTMYIRKGMCQQILKHMYMGHISFDE